MKTNKTQSCKTCIYNQDINICWVCYKGDKYKPKRRKRNEKIID